MKKVLITLLIGIVGCLFATAESLWFNAYEYAYKYKTTANYNTQQGWSDWNDCSVPIEFDLSKDMIIIYSNKTQIYAIYESMGEYHDSTGGHQLGYKVIDQDYDYGQVRLRVAKDGTSQIYIDFNDVGWVYNVVKR